MVDDIASGKLNGELRREICPSPSTQQVVPEKTLARDDNIRTFQSGWYVLTELPQAPKNSSKILPDSEQAVKVAGREGEGEVQSRTLSILAQFSPA